MNNLRIVLCLFAVLICPPGWSAVDHVILVSLDGLRPDAITKFKGKLPHFHQLIDEGASTLNARTDVDFTSTVPNHTAMLTGRPVKGEAGHGVQLNKDTTKTVHQLKGSYVKSIFDVLHEHQLSSVMCASKSKFKIFADSYAIGQVHVAHQDDAMTMQSVNEILRREDLPAFLFVHLAGADLTGHADGWELEPHSSYVQTVFQLDKHLGQIMTAVRDFNAQGQSTVLIVTGDHGGKEGNHLNPRIRENYTIPFFAWGAGVAGGKDLYQLNKTGRADPGTAQVPYHTPLQPIRNGEAANLALNLLGLGCVPQSTIGCDPVLLVGETVVK